MESTFRSLSQKGSLIAFFLMMIAFNLSLSFFMPKEYALDLKFAYTFSEAWNSLSAMDMDTRDLYRKGIWFLDLPYLIVYSVFFSGLLYRLMGMKRVVFLPFLVASFDFIENLLVLRLLKIFPEPSKVLTLTASVATTLKWIAVAIMLGIVLFGIFRLVFSKKYFPQSSSRSRL
ncbi:hypothetical protein OU792_09150 [Algoriphagus sp. NF]|uniref:Uncharacterized protein n=1 Tax=Algoriphagus marincola TaxID=264027 RepID=A0ABS7N7T9_9BACT|nr:MULTISPECIES: hypothetical protein [Algoriphagus]MBY5952398.1 hypothetical protein [Algoriphagus marincola]MCR9083122.1 hypothetical protein [Cyclobacteriaceae bacterium]MDE0560149.1 hypothetical protein [Algoriphagus sp. NF]